MATTAPAQRQAASRSRKKADGYTRVTLRFNRNTITKLRGLAKREGSTQATVIATALEIFGNKELLNDIKAWGAERRQTMAARKQAGGQ